MGRRHWAALAALGVAASMAACGSAGEATRTTGNSSAVVTGEPAAPPAEQTETAPEAAASADLVVAEQGFTQLPAAEYSEPAVSYAVVFENTGDAIARGARVQLTFTGDDGSVITSQEERLTAVLPGTKVALADSLYDTDGVTDLSVQVLPGDVEPLEDEPANFTSEQVGTVAEEFGGLTTTATVTSPFSQDLEDLYATAVYRDAAGEIVGGAFTFLSFVPAKGSAGVEISDTWWSGDQPATTEVYVQLSGLSLLS